MADEHVEITQRGDVGAEEPRPVAPGRALNSASDACGKRNTSWPFTRIAVAMLPTDGTTVTVTGANDSPTAVGSIADQNDDDSTVISGLDVSGQFADVDVSEALAYSASGLPAGLSIDPTSGVISGTIDASASQGSGGSYPVVVTATDAHGASVEQRFTWSVSNPDPVATANAYSVAEDDGVAVVGNAITDGPADSDPDGDALTASVVSDAPGDDGGLFSIASNGVVSFDPNGEFEDLAAGEIRETTYTYTLEDADGGSAMATITVTVSGANDAPTAVGAIGDQRLELGSNLLAVNGICVGVGLPMVSVRMPIMLWKYAVVRRPPFHHVE